MRAEPDRYLTQVLSETLRLEADQIEVAPDARTRLDRRIALRSERRSRLRWPGPAVAVLALGLVVTVVVLISSGGGHRSATPAPVASPTASATSGTPEPTPGTAAADLPTTLVYYPRPDGRLMAEPRSRTTLAAAVAELGGEPSNEEVAWPFGSMKLESVTEQDGAVVVDYSADDHVRPGHPDVQTAGLWAQSLVHTVAAYTGEQRPVHVTLRRQSFVLFDRLDTREPLRYQEVEDDLWTGVSQPSQAPTASPTTVVGSVGPRIDQVAWKIQDPGTRRTLRSGTAPVHADRTYAFAVAMPPGSYALRVYAGDPDDKATRSYDGGFTIE